jgi:hypothetical protein
VKTSRNALSRSGRVAALLTLIAVVAACGSGNPLETAATSGPSAGSAASASTPPVTGPAAEVQTSGPAPSETNQTTLPKRVALNPEREPVDGTERTETGEVICGQGLLTIPRLLGNITPVGAGDSKFQISAYHQGLQGVTIKISDGPSSLYALIVDGEATTVIPRELRLEPTSILGLDYSEWGEPIKEVVGCASVE